MKFVIDTDLGTDSDDLFALTYALRSEVPVEALSIVQGDVLTRGRIARKMEKLLGVDVPIVLGEKGPNPEKYWNGSEREVLTSEDEAYDSFIRSEFDKITYTAGTKLIAIGPLTNIAHQLDTLGTIASVGDVYVMGSDESSHNFVVDPEATRKIFNQSWNIYQITKRDSLEVAFEPSELEEIRGNPLGEFLYDSTIRGMKQMGRTNATMYDVLAVSAALDEGLVKFKQQAENRFVSDGVDAKELKMRIVEKIK